MADVGQINPYLKTKVLTARPEELRLMLLDGALKFLHQGRQGILDKDIEASFEGLSQARQIVMELLNCIDPAHDPELGQRMTSLYTYIYTNLVEAGHDRDLDRVDEVIKLIEYERETWAMLIQQLAEEPGATPSGSNERDSFSAQG